MARVAVFFMSAALLAGQGRRLHDRALVFDGHVHAVDRVFYHGGDIGQRKSDGQFDLARAKEGEAVNESGSIWEPVGCDRPSRPRYVLIVCYNYPGIWADGVIRTYQFAKRLPCFGWQPIILTSQPWAENREDDIETADGALNCLRISVPKTVRGL